MPNAIMEDMERIINIFASRRGETVPFFDVLPSNEHLSHYDS